MGRPRKQDSEINDLERRDTMYWCDLIKSISGLTDIQIEEKLEPAGLTKRQLADRRAGTKYVPPSGRNFNRWLRGERAMSHDSISILLVKAREVGLLPLRKNLGTHATAAIEARAMVGSKNKATDELLATLKSVRELHEARRSLDNAARVFQNAAAVAEKHGVDIFDSITAAQSSCPDDESFEGCKIEGISKKISEIASWYFFQGVALTLSE